MHDSVERFRGGRGDAPVRITHLLSLSPDIHSDMHTVIVGDSDDSDLRKVVATLTTPKYAVGVAKTSLCHWRIMRALARGMGHPWPQLVCGQVSLPPWQRLVGGHACNV